MKKTSANLFRFNVLRYYYNYEGVNKPLFSHEVEGRKRWEAVKHELLTIKPNKSTDPIDIETLRQAKAFGKIARHGIKEDMVPIFTTLLSEKPENLKAFLEKTYPNGFEFSASTTLTLGEFLGDKF